jgi:hypothetical protein
MPPTGSSSFEGPPASLSTTAELRCLAECFKRRVSRKCARQMCKPHCLERGGCNASGHSAGPFLQHRQGQQQSIRSLGVQELPSQSTTRGSLVSDQLIDPQLLVSSSTTGPLPTVLSVSTSEPSQTTVSNPTPSRSLQTGPKMTRQMSEIWMEEYQDNRQAPRRTPKAGGRGAQREVAAVRRFLLVYWDVVCDIRFSYGPCLTSISQENQPAIIRVIQHCPDWPSWVFEASILPLSNPVNPVKAIDTYDPKYAIWIQVELNYAFAVSTDAVLFIRRRDVHPLDFKDHCTRFLTKSKASHIRHNMPAERQKIRQALRDLNGRVSHDLSDSEVEVLSPLAKRRGSYPSVPSPKRLCFSSPVKTDSDLELDVLSPPSPKLDILSPPSPKLDILSPPSPKLDISSPPSPKSSLLEADDSCAALSGSASWPNGWYAVDMCRGFKLIDKLESSNLSIEKRFWLAFGLPFVRSTYYDARRRWTRATQEQREIALNAGYREKGIWSVFARHIPLK